MRAIGKVGIAEQHLMQGSLSQAPNAHVLAMFSQPAMPVSWRVVPIRGPISGNRRHPANHDPERTDANGRFRAINPLTSPPALNEFGLPTRNPLRAVGIAGSYVKATDAPSHREGWFEVMVRRRLPRAGSGQVFAFVHRLEPKTNERMELFLAEQGVFPAQPTAFLSDGGETVRQAHGEFRKFGEPILDWLHLALRTTRLTQSIQGLAAEPPIEGLTWDIGPESPRDEALQDKPEEFMNYLTALTAAIPSYVDCHSHGEPIATGFVESAVNQAVSNRLVRMQQMRWTMAGAHHLLQVRSRVLNQQLRNDFERWHPQRRAAADPVRTRGTFYSDGGTPVLIFGGVVAM